MSLKDNQTFALWKTFMAKRNLISGTIGSDLYSIEIYPPNYFDGWDPATVFEKWAAVEVNDFMQVPDFLETLVCPEGPYAVFTHRGAARDAPETYQWIFGKWIPSSEYTVDHRPHFAVMGEKSLGEDPKSEEEIWIPVKRSDSTENEDVF